MAVESRFIEQMGQHFERDGMPRIAGRVFGQLLLVEKPMSLDELAESLQVSKASVSTNTRLLESANMIERRTFPGDRRDYYGVSDTVNENMLDFRLQRFQATLKLLADGLDTDAAKSPLIRRRLESFSLFFERMVEAIAEARDTMTSQSGNGEER